jgi:site-specific recombinase XerD
MVERKMSEEDRILENLPDYAFDLLDAGADLSFVKDWLGHANIQNTTIYAQVTTGTRDSKARQLFASHRVV